MQIEEHISLQITDIEDIKFVALASADANILLIPSANKMWKRVKNI